MSTVFVPVSNAELMYAKNSWLIFPSFKDFDTLTGRPILPVEGEKNVLVTSAFPDVNSIPHLGDIGSVLSADVFARYCRSRGWNTLYVSGVNEHGTETEKKALEANMSPQELCDKYFEIHKEIYECFNINFDKFGRTTSYKQTKLVHKIFDEINDNGYTSIAVMEHLLCENCVMFTADYNVEETCPMCCFKDTQGVLYNIKHNANATKLLKPRCNSCQKTISVNNSREYLLNLYKVEAKLKDWVDKFSDSWSYNAQVITKSMVEDCLKRVCITRAMKWGISQHFRELDSKVFYDWFATPISYISATAEYSKQWRQWWMPNDDTKITYYQFIDKNDVQVHSVLFPGILFATERNYTFVNHINAIECLKYEHGEFSKTRGIGVFGNDVENTTLSSDILRFYMMFIRPESQDSSFDWVHLAITNNLHLVKNLGCFYDRTLLKLRESCDSTIPEILLGKDDLIFLALVTRYHKQYITMLDNGKLKDGLLQIISISRLCNEYISIQLLPWTPNQNLFEFRSRSVIGLCCNLVCLLAILLKPYMPETAIKMTKQMNVDISNVVLNDYVGMLLEPGHKIGEHVPIFKFIDFQLAFKLKSRFSGDLMENKNKNNQNLEKNIFSLSGQDLLFTSNNEQLEQAITEQSEIIKILKQGHTKKSELKPYVDGLSKMKKKLKTAAVSNSTSNV